MTTTTIDRPITAPPAPAPAPPRPPKPPTPGPVEALLRDAKALIDQPHKLMACWNQAITAAAKDGA